MLDTHTHLLRPSREDYPWLTDERMTGLRRDFWTEELVALLHRHAVDAAVLVQTRSSLEETLGFLDLAAHTPEIAGVIGWTDLLSPEFPRRLEQLLCSTNGQWLVGLRHQVHDEADPHWLNQPALHGALRALAGTGLSYDLLIRERELPAAIRTVQAHPEVRFVIDHGAKPDLKSGPSGAWTSGMQALATCPNTWVKLSGLITEADWDRWSAERVVEVMERLLGWFGSARCLFGSDWPVCTLAGTYGDVVHLFEHATRTLSAAQRQQVLAGGALLAYPRLKWPSMTRQDRGQNA